MKLIINKNKNFKKNKKFNLINFHMNLIKVKIILFNGLDLNKNFYLIIMMRNLFKIKIIFVLLLNLGLIIKVKKV